MVSAIYIFVAVLLSFLSSRFIFGGDSAEFSTIAHTWSIPHPPGYPLYSFLTNCIAHIIPFGTIPWRVSLLSVVPTVLTVYLLYKILTQLKVRLIVAFFVSLLYIVLFPVWEYSLIPEVFALNSFLVIAVTYFLLRYRISKKNKYIYLSLLFLGLCVAHHQVFVIFVPGWFLLIKDNIKKIVRSGRRWLFLVGFFILGTSFYLYVPIASYFNPPLQWEDGKTLLGFWRLVTRAMYGSFTAYRGSGGNIINQLNDIFSSFVLIFQDFRMIGVLCIGVGILFTFKHKNRFFQFLALTSLVHIFFLFYTNFMLVTSFSLGMYERFLISFYAILILYLALGFDFLYGKILQFISRKSNKKNIHTFARVCLLLFLVIYIVAVAQTNYRAISYIKNGRDFDRLGDDIANTPPPGSIYFAGSDTKSFTTLYKSVVENRNPRAVFFQMGFSEQKYYTDQFRKNNPTLKFPQSLQTQHGIERFFKLNKERGIYLETPTPFGFWMPYGLLWKYYETQAAGLADLSNIVKANTYLWRSVYHIPELNNNTRNILHLQTVQDSYLDAYTSYSKLLYLAHENNQAQNVMENIIVKYRPSDNNAKFALLNLLLLDKKCTDAKKIARQMYSAPVDLLDASFISPLINYYSVCDVTNKSLPLLKERWENTKEKSLTPLSNF